MTTHMDEEKINWMGYTNIAIAVGIGILALMAMFTNHTFTFQMPVLIPPNLAVDQPIWLLMFLGLVIGCYGTIVGIGGGPLILPILVFFYGWENEILVATSLFIVMLNSASGSS